MLEKEPPERFVVQAVASGTFYIGVPDTDYGTRVRGRRSVTRKLVQWPIEILSKGIDYKGVAERDQLAIEEARIRLVNGAP